MKLEVLKAEPRGAQSPRDILFVHGVYHGAWCWERFMPYFAAQGYRCNALSLRGHGNSEGVERLTHTGFADYLDDVVQTVQELGKPPILVGHSLGGMLAQKYAEQYPVPALVLISTPTPRSLMRAPLKLMRAFPVPMLKMMLSLNPDHLYKNPAVVRKLFFGEHLPEEEFSEFVAALLGQNESRRIFRDVLSLKFAKLGAKVPALVIGGREDFAVDAGAFRETAARFDTQPLLLDGMPHDVMLDNHWIVAAERIHGWLNRQGL
jgi:pimeloyl-ACP methyl ester carboxylesterase